jgi:hypothetical protein
MNDTSSNDFTSEELNLIHDILARRYGAPVETQQADIEVGNDEDDRELTECPAVYWEHKDCHFILAKAADDKFFSQFFYGDSEQFGTGKPFYDDLHNCVITLLQVQADYELNKAGVLENSLLTPA